MSIIKKIKKTIEIEEEKSKDIKLDKLNEYYEKVKKLGVVKKQEYNIPPVDTIGRRLYEQYIVREKEEPYNK